MRLLILFLLWCILLVYCWPLAILALVLFPILWLLSLPFRLLAIVLEALFATLRAILLLPARILSLPFQRRRLRNGTLISQNHPQARMALRVKCRLICA